MYVPVVSGRKVYWRWARAAQPNHHWSSVSGCVNESLAITAERMGIPRAEVKALLALALGLDE